LNEAPFKGETAMREEPNAGGTMAHSGKQPPPRPLTDSKIIGTYTKIHRSDNLPWDTIEIAEDNNNFQYVLKVGDPAATWGYNPSDNSQSPWEFKHSGGLDYMYVDLCPLPLPATFDKLITITYLGYSDPLDDPATGVWLGRSSGSPCPPPKQEA
jgi:hypothetical protein